MARLPTRLRLELPGLLGNRARARSVELSLRRMTGVGSVRASTTTGRVLVKLAHESPRLAQRVRRAVLRLADPEAPPPPSIRAGLAGIARRAHRSIAGRARRGNPLQTRPPTPPWHSMRESAVIAELAVDVRRGLAHSDARQRSKTAGPNVLAALERRTAAKILAGQVLTVPTALLGSAAALSAAMGDLLETGAVLLVLGSNVVVGYLTESRAEELIEAWNEIQPESARVVRAGEAITVAAPELVAGDVLLVRRGDLVAADARLIECEDLTVDESTLTGESEPVRKTTAPVRKNTILADRRCMLHAGTTIAGGSGRAVVVATGMATAAGETQRALSDATTAVAPLERQLSHLGKQLAAAAVAGSVAIVAIGMLHRRGVRELVRSAVALAVAGIPEGLPAAGTSALALSSRRLRRQGVLIRRLTAAETLGAVSAVCADKTGTLTENRMRVVEILVPSLGAVDVEWLTDGPRGGEHVKLTRASDGRGGIDPALLHDLARIAALNADVELGRGGVVASGSGTERALVEFARAVGYPVPARRRGAKRVGQVRRTSERNFMITVHQHPTLGRVELIKGAPDQVLRQCGLGRRDQTQWAARNAAMASRGLRVLALGWRRRSRGHGSQPFEFAGLVGLRDPTRRGVRDALATLKRAGIETLMLTGDQELTARAIGRLLGIRPEAVYARVTPEAKVKIVEELQAQGRIVAMTGDGVNDGPALKAAHVGIAMGERGTRLAHAVADVVLAHDDLPSLATAVAEGRRLYDNVRRATAYLVATNMSELMVMLIGAAFGRAPLGALQLLWLNLLTDVAPAVALTLEPAESEAMRRPPRDPATPLLTRRDYARLGADASGMAAPALFAYVMGHRRCRGDGAGNDARPRTMAFLSLVTSQILYARACRSQSRERNGLLGQTVAGGLALQAAAIASPALRRILGATRLARGDLAIAVACALAPTIVREARKLVHTESRTAKTIVVTHADTRASVREPRSPSLRRARRPTHSRATATTRVGPRLKEHRET